MIRSLGLTDQRCFAPGSPHFPQRPDISTLYK